ncbi:MAG: chemotaxis-specific protein-glutamate methyltransferase CheB [Deltaproteobacteria bacterium]|nr:chemotaxis-specific protein-glutamate methyltransferase CheB [Deltaproteobacteria bacterium]
MKKEIRVLVVDDSAFNRVSIGKMLEKIPEVRIVGFASDGEEGLQRFFELKPDLVTLDLEMPKLGGFSMLRLMMQARPTPVLVISSHSGQADVFKALELGAMDFVAKPSRPVSAELYSIQDNLTRILRDFAGFAPEQFRLTDAGRSLPAVQPEAVTPVAVKRAYHPRVVVIGSSTGGPPALHRFFSSFREVPPLIFAVAQHMPPNFTRSFAERLNSHSVLEVKEAAHGDVMRPGAVYICPGGQNLLVQRRGDQLVARIVKPPAGQIYTPSVDALFQSAAQTCGAEVLGLVLTGMGNDGARGTRMIKEQGGMVLAESEESCVVYGMPKEAVATGCVSQVIPLDKLRLEILRYRR